MNLNKNTQKTSKNESMSRFSVILAPNLVPRGGSAKSLFHIFFSFAPSWGPFAPSWAQEVPQKPPEPSQTSIFHDFCKICCQIFVIFGTTNMKSCANENKKGDKTPGTLYHFYYHFENQFLTKSYLWEIESRMRTNIF